MSENLLTEGSDLNRGRLSQAAARSRGSRWVSVSMTIVGAVLMLGAVLSAVVASLYAFG